MIVGFAATVQCVKCGHYICLHWTEKSEIFPRCTGDGEPCRCDGFEVDGAEGAVVNSGSRVQRTQTPKEKSP